MGKGRGKGRSSGYWDELLAYDTIRFVRIKNACVGGMHYFFLAVIVAYLAGYVFIYQKKYLDINAPIANARFSTMGPCQPKTSADLCKKASKATPIAAVGESCMRNFQCNQHNYCAAPYTQTKANSGVGGTAPCVFWDHNAVTFPPSEKNALTIATRVSIYNQKLQYPNGTACGVSKPASENWDCQWMPSVVSGKSYDAYVADILNFTISMASDVAASSLPISKSNNQMKGNLVKCKPGAKCLYDAPDDFTQVAAFNNGNAVFTVGELVDAIVPADHKGVAGPGLNLDAKSDACPAKCLEYSTGKHLASTNRWMGLAVLLDIQYDNTGLLIKESSFDDVRYRIRAYTIPESVFRVEVPYYQQNGRVIHHLHGIRIVTQAKGHLGQFSANTVLIQLTTSLALLALATTVVDILLLHFMKNKAYYQAIKYQDDEDALNTIGNKAERDALLKETGGLDYKALLTGGLASDAGT